MQGDFWDIYQEKTHLVR